MKCFGIFLLYIENIFFVLSINLLGQDSVLVFTIFVVVSR